MSDWNVPSLLVLLFERNVNGRFVSDVQTLVQLCANETKFQLRYKLPNVITLGKIMSDNNNKAYSGWPVVKMPKGF